MIIVILQDKDGSEVLECTDGTVIFKDQASAMTAANDTLRGLEPGRIWAEIFELRLIATARPGQ